MAVFAAIEGGDKAGGGPLPDIPCGVIQAKGIRRELADLRSFTLDLPWRATTTAMGAWA